MQKVKFIFLELFLLKEFMNMISYSANLGHNSLCNQPQKLCICLSWCSSNVIKRNRIVKNWTFTNFAIADLVLKMFRELD